MLILMLCGVGAQGHGDVHALIEQLNGQIEAAPNSVELRLERANLLRQHGQYKEALEDLKCVEKLAPQNSDRLYLQAKIDLAKNRWMAALQGLDIFISIQPSESEPYALRSLAWRNLGEWDRAERDALEAIRRHPHAPLNLHLDYIDMLAKRNDFEAALIAYTQAEESLGPLPVLLKKKAQWLAENKRYPEAAATYARLRKHHPALTFSCWAEEADMWAGIDPQKAEEAAQQARLAWEHLPQRQRSALQNKYTQLVQLNLGEQP